MKLEFDKANSLLVDFYNNFKIDPLSLIPDSINKIINEWDVSPEQFLLDILRPNNSILLKENYLFLSGYKESNDISIIIWLPYPLTPNISTAYINSVIQRIRNILNTNNIYYTAVYRGYPSLSKLNIGWQKFGKLLLFCDILQFSPKYVICIGPYALKSIMGSQYTFNQLSNRVEIINNVRFLFLPDVLNQKDSKNYYTLSLYLSHIYKVIHNKYISVRNPIFIRKRNEIDNIPIPNNSICALDCEWHGHYSQFSDLDNNFLISLQYTCDGVNSYVLVFREDRKPVLNYSDCKYFLDKLIQANMKIIGHNFNADLLWLDFINPELKKYFIADTMLLAYVLNENYPLSLDILRLGFTNIPAYEHRVQDIIKKYRIKKDAGYGDIPFKTLGIYAGYDVIVTYRLYHILNEKILQNKVLSNLYYNIIHPALFGIFEMMQRGVKINISLIDNLINFYKSKTEETYNELKRWVKSYIQSLKDQFIKYDKIISEYNQLLNKKNSLQKQLYELKKANNILTTLQLKYEDYIHRFKLIYPNIDPTNLDQKISSIYSDLTEYENVLKTHQGKYLSETWDNFQLYNKFNNNFDPRSSECVSCFLYKVLNLPVLLKTSSGAPSTDALTLKLLYNETKNVNIKYFLDLFLKFRLLDHMLSCFVKSSSKDKGLLSHIRNGHIYTTILPTQESGRYRCLKPNLMQLPKSAEKRISKYYSDIIPIRNIFIPHDGYKFLSADYSQAELFITAAVSGDKNMQDILYSGKDLHSEMAYIIFKPKVTSEIAAKENLPINTLLPVNLIKKYYPDLRFICKSINFGMIYGRGVDSIYTSLIADGLDIKKEDVQKVYDTFFEMFPKVKEYIDKCTKFIRKNGYIQNIFGRYRRFYPPIPNEDYPSSIYREGMNFTIQSTVADVLSIAIKNLMDYKRKYNLTDKYYLILSIHDQLILEVKNDFIEEGKDIIIQCMCFKLPKLNISLNVDISISDKWETD